MEGSTLTRRHAFKLAGLAGAAVALRGAAATAQEAQADRIMPPPKKKPLPQGAGFYRTHAGDFEVTIVSDGSFQLTPYPTIGSNATKEQVEGLLTENFIEPSSLMGQVNALVVRSKDDSLTVIDTGCGKLFGPAAGFFRENFANAGFKVADVKNVIFTHLHPDHAGGALDEAGNLLFPNAKYFVHKAEVDFWTGKSPDFSKSGVPAAMQPTMIGAATKVITAIGDKLTTFDSATTGEVLPGITYGFTGGHTPGHCTIQIKSGDASLHYVGDFIVQSILVLAHPEWLVGFDTDMPLTAERRKVLFEVLAKDKALVCGSHLPFPSLGHIKKDGGGYAFVPSLWKWA
ncbi:MAG: MBL fold metallo-hydrolase [Tepidisphaeraceae bacterium]